MFDILTRELKRARRESSTLSIIMADLDHFKAVNDRLGHAAGDAVLQEAARRMSLCIRPYDSACRYGGEEFLIVLPGCDLTGATMRAEEIRSAMAAAHFQIPEGVLSVTCSLGVTSSSGDAGFDDSVLLHEADEALYAAKHNGRNRVEIFARQPVLTH
jgi:diguanylate cyclase (GGDEF)-like protein